MKDTQQTITGVLTWPKRLLSADDLRRHLTSQRELLLLPRTVITPLAADELRAKGVTIRWQESKAKDDTTPKQGAWCYAQETADTMIHSAIKALERDGLTLTPLEYNGPRKLAETIVTSQLGGIVFCGDPASVCCIANKIAGMRAAAVVNVAQVNRSRKNLGATLYAIEMPGRSFFEVRQLLRAIVAGSPSCPEKIAQVLKELDGHAHR